MWSVAVSTHISTSIISVSVISNRSINYLQAIPMTRSSIQGRRSDAVHRFRRLAAWNAGTVCGSLARRSACNAAPPREVCPRRTPKRSTPRTAAARNTKAQIRHHPVSWGILKIKNLSYRYFPLLRKRIFALTTVPTQRSSQAAADWDLFGPVPSSRVVQHQSRSPAQRRHPNGRARKTLVT